MQAIRALGGTHRLSSLSYPLCGRYTHRCSEGICCEQREECDVNANDFYRVDWEGLDQRTPVWEYEGRRAGREVPREKKKKGGGGEIDGGIGDLLVD